MKALFIAVGAGAAAVTAAAMVLVSAGGSAPAASYPPGLYLYTGDGNTVPVKLAGNPSSVPTEIHTSVPQYGAIKVGHGPLPPGNGYSGEEYPGWIWYLGDSVDGHPLSVQLNWAKLGSDDTVIQNVVGDFQGVGNFRTLTGGGYTTRCLSFVDPSTSQAHWLYLNLAADWVAASAGCSGESKFSGEEG